MGIHGGDVYRNHVRLDFSVNINPLGIPQCVKEALHSAVSYCSRYPDMEAEQLKTAVSKYLKVPEEYLLFGNGASELLMAIVHGIRPKKVVIPIPSFYGYENAANAVDSEIVFCAVKEMEKFLTEETELLFLANPNNPLGSLLSKDKIIELLSFCRNKGIYVVLDECFIEFCGNQSSILSELEETEGSDCLILVRAFTKIFAIPGVRLGYLICKNRNLRKRIARQIPEWNLSCFAQEAGILCARQTAFIIETENYVTEERKFLEEGLKRKGLQVLPSAANFIMVYSREPLYERLLEKGILIRDCSNFRGLGRGFYRIAVKTREENEQLLENL